MFGNKGQRADRVDTIIGPGTEFEGTIKATGIVKVDGKFTGTITTTGDIEIGDKGLVKADVVGNNTVVAGKIIGNIKSKEKTTILHKGVVEGDILTKNIIIEQGGILKGKCTMGDDKETAK